MKMDAVLSEDRKYRYQLSRVWELDGRMILFIGLNPSTANEIKDDPTIRRCIGFAKDWGYGGLFMGNLFAMVTPYPNDLSVDPESVGKRNDECLEEMWAKSCYVVAAWGNEGHRMDRGEHVAKRFGTKLWCFGVNQSGQPKHPLYLPKAAKLMKYSQSI